MKSKIYFRLCLLIVGFVFFNPQKSEATIYTIDVSLRGTQEFPPNASTGIGSFRGTYDDVTNILNFQLRFSGLTAPTTAAHLHAPAAPGVNAPVVIGFVGFPVGVTSGMYINTYTLTDAQESQLLCGLWYVNVHTSAFPGGEIRGQLQEAPSPTFDITISGTQEVPTNPSTGVGNLTGSYNAVSNELSINIAFTGLVAPTTAAHLHAPATPGVNAGVVIGFVGFPVGVTSGTYANTYILTEAQETQLLAGLWYVNIHSSTFPGGEIRGQLVEGTLPISCAASPTVTINQAAGQLDPSSTSPINFTVVFSEPVTSFATGDITLSGTAGATTGTVSGAGPTYNVAVSGMTGSGTVIATVGAGVATGTINIIGNAASTSTDNTVTYNMVVVPAPCVSITTIACAEPATAILVGAGIWSPGSCGFSTPGNEKVYSFTPTVTGVHSLQVTAAAGGFVDYFFKAASGGCSATGWTCIDDFFSPGTTNIGTLTAGVEYYILLDAEFLTSVTQTFQINCTSIPCPTATISYAGSPYCSNAGTANVTRTGNADGTYSASPSGLTLDPITGSVTLGTSTSGTYTVTYTIAAGGGCPLYTTTTTITVNPTPNAIATPSLQTICSGAPITTIVLTSGVVGTTFTWTRDNAAAVTGIPGNGVGNISGTLTNITLSPVTVTFTITPSANGCTGSPINATVLVNPTPTVLATPSSQSICNASAITPIVLTSGVAGTTFSWTRDNVATVTGLAANGSGTPITGTLTNTTNASVMVTFTITTTANGCPGSTTTATVEVYPAASVDPIANQTVCTGTPTAAVNFSSPVGGVTYNWTNNTTSIGLGASGTGNIPSFIATNSTLLPVTATITVTPSLIFPGLCAISAPQTFTNNTPVVIPTTAPPNVVSSTIVVSGVPTYLYDVDILTNLRHTFSSDLDITIMSPAGTIVTLTTDNGGGFDNVFNGTLWNDKANPAGQVPYTTNNGVTTDNSYVNLTTATPMVAEEAFGAFIGENPNGTWTITISDDGNLDGGTLDSWSVIVSGLSASPTLVNSSYSNTTPVTIPTTAPPNVVTSTINVAGAGSILSKVNITTFLKHTFSSDLDVTLMSPAGTVVTLTTDNGGGNDNVFNGTVWNDKANPGGQVPYTANNGVVTDHTYANLTLASPMVPEEALGAFVGENPNGTWTLTISDDANLDGGSLDSWSLDLQTASCPIICTGTPKIFTITVNPLPTMTCPANMTVASDVGVCNKTVNYTPIVTGTPAPTLSYVLTGATSGSGNGSGSGLKFNVGVTTVTITATNTCATVMCSFTVTVTDSQLPLINTQPVNRTVCAGSNATFTVAAVTAPSAGGSLSYLWQSWTGSAWVTATGTGGTTNTFTVNSVTQAMNTNSYRVQVIGLCTTVTSTFATLFVNPLPTINLTTSIPPALLPTQVLTITATVNPAGGTYVWYKNGLVIPGVTGNTLSGRTVSDIGTYRVEYTDLNGCKVTSSNVEITGQPSENLYVYPVPNQGVFNVRFFNQANEQVMVRVFDSKGAEVYSRKLLTTIPYTTITVDMSANRILINGTYIIDIRGADGRPIGSRKIIVNK